jgi:23S rRNA (adenine2503-C2)-methyltransferase
VEREFARKVRRQGVSCTVRDTRGREIAAACGQLAGPAGRSEATRGPT